jgi:hypothetical protein
MNSRIVLLFVGAEHVELNNWLWIRHGFIRSARMRFIPRNPWRAGSTTVKNKTWCFQSIRRHRSGGAPPEAEQREREIRSETAMMSLRPPAARRRRDPREHSHASDLCPIFLFNRSPCELGRCAIAGNQRPNGRPLPCIPCTVV